MDLANDAQVLGVEQGPDMFILTVEEKERRRFGPDSPVLQQGGYEH